MLPLEHILITAIKSFIFYMDPQLPKSASEASEWAFPPINSNSLETSAEDVAYIYLPRIWRN
jgi:hypothetical protein